MNFNVLPIMDETSGTLDKRHQSFFLFLQSFSSILIWYIKPHYWKQIQKEKIFCSIFIPLPKVDRKGIKIKLPLKKSFSQWKKANKNILADLIFTSAQVVLISAKISFKFMPLSAVQIYMTFIYSQSFNILSVYFYKLIVWFYNDI